MNKILRALHLEEDKQKKWADFIRQDNGLPLLTAD